MLKYKIISIFLFAVLILVSPVSSQFGSPDNTITNIDLNNQIQIDSALWSSSDVVTEGTYSGDVDTMDAVFDGSTYHLIYSIDNSIGTGLEYVYYTSNSGSGWTTPIVIFDGSQGDAYNNYYTSIESVALEYSAGIFYVAINAHYSITDSKVLYIESLSTMSNITTNKFNYSITGNAFHRPENIRLVNMGTMTVLGYEVLEDFNGYRPYIVMKDDSVGSFFNTPVLIANNTYKVNSDLYFQDITYSALSSKFIVTVRNVSLAIGERVQFFESSDTITWMENTVYGKLPVNPDGFSVASIDEYNNELYATYMINGDELDSGQFNDLVIAKTSAGVFQPYIELIYSRTSVKIQQMTRTMFVNGNIVVISVVRSSKTSDYVTDPDVIKMFTRTGIDVAVPSAVSIINPADQTIFNNQTLEIVWSVTSGEFGYYNIFQNDVMIKLGTNDYWGSWESNYDIIYTDNLRLTEGIYNFTIVLYDTQGNSLKDTVWITSIVAPIDMTSNVDTATAFVNEALPNAYWYIYGGLSGSYTVYRNDTAIQSASYTYDQVKYNLYISLSDGPQTNVGVYNYTLYAIDSSGDYTSNSIMITVKEHTPLTITSPTDMTYDSSQVFEIYWTVTGESSSNIMNFNVDINGSYTHTPTYGNWSDGETIIITDGPIPAGVYSYTFRLSNGSLEISDTVIITIVEAPIPVVSSPKDISILKDNNAVISWTIKSSSSGTYTIYKDNAIVTGDIWSKDVTIDYSELFSTAGVYNFTIVVEDTISNVVVDTVIVTVLDPIIPILDNPSDLTVYNNQTFSLSWVVNSKISGTYTIYKNGTVFQDGTWDDGDTIQMNDGPLLTGYYNYSISVTTTEGSVSFSVFVTVVGVPKASLPGDETTANSITTTSNSSSENTVSSDSKLSFISVFMLMIISIPVITIIKRKNILKS